MHIDTLHHTFSITPACTDTLPVQVTITVMVKGLDELGATVDVDDPQHLKVVVGKDESVEENILLLGRSIRVA